MIRKVLATALIVFFLAGCGAVQIENRAFVTAIGLDLADEGSTGRYLVTIEVFRPGTMQSNTQQPPVIILSVATDNFEMALEQLQSRLATRISLAHLTLVIVGEEAAKEFDFREVTDYFHRHPEIQMRARLMAAQDKRALDILKTEPLYREYISQELVAMAEMWPYVSLARRNPFFDFVADLRRTGGRGLLPRVMKSDEGEFIIRHGSAVFDNYKLVGWLSSEETQAINWLMEDVQVPVTASFQGEEYSYLTKDIRTKIIPEIEDDKVRFHISIETDGILRQQLGHHVDMSDPANVSGVESALAQTIEGQVRSAVDKAQQDFGTDYLGFQSILRRHHPQAHQRLDWDKIFPHIPVSIAVESHLSRFGKIE
ncbi:Ger(x)C family spore germination protein [Dethiobacter alkaliphilus]|uniref:Germination protein, Ger(X)C family n=1 Tax=Dethiobacter alkaliphilus AHT 1 TaxID=555088 RepID=C0GIJ1_DETAL|nr:Ger(x)C family spore germination protein [Dethiobacter alkaliphilus]EEG76852.1 germination protein, Ger(x)C family [Dethiobacter alkaliphilus AHT 1]